MPYADAEQTIGKSWLQGRLRYCENSEGMEEAVGYYKNGTVQFRYPVKNGTLNGLGSTWRENGVLQCEENCRNGELDGPARYWYPEGNLEKETHYRLGRLHGPEKVWYPTGQLKAQCSHVEDSLEGSFTEWYLEGMIKTEFRFDHGRRHGIQKLYEKDGSLKLKEIYVRGVRMPVRKYEKLLAGHFSAKDILAVRNAAVRRIFIEEFGYARFLAEMPHEVIDRDGEQELVRINWHEREEPICLVKVKCPSTRAFYTLRVPPGRLTVKSAIAWTFDVPVDDYEPKKET